MSLFNPGPTISVPSGESLAIYRRVKISTSGKAYYADATDTTGFGIAMRPTDTTVPGKDIATVQMQFAGVSPAVASEAISAAALVAAADDGKVKAAAANGANAIGVALGAATGDDSRFSVLYFSARPAATTPQVITEASASGAITIQQGIVKITKAGVAALTLAAPTAAQEGTRLTVISNTANAHTITATGLIDDGVTGGSKTTATFAAFAGASITLVAINLKWSVEAKNAVTLS